MKANNHNKGIAGTHRDPRGNGRWLWFAVSVGTGSRMFTHENGKNKLAFAILPKKDYAPRKRPPGAKSLKAVIKKHVAKQSFLIFYGWKYSKTAPH